MKKIVLSTLMLTLGISAFAQQKEVYPFYYPCRAEETGEWGYVDANNNWTIRAQYSAVMYETNGGMYPVSKGGKWGLVGVSGQPLTDIKFDAVMCEIDYVKNNYPAYFAAVRLRGKWAFVDVQGKFVTGFNYDEVLIMKGKYTIRQKTEKGKMRTGHLTKDGKEVWEN